MYDSMEGWDWVWMSLAMTGWVVVLAIAVYLAVTLATRRTDRRP